MKKKILNDWSVLEKVLNLLVTVTERKRLALSLRFSPFSNIILRLFRGTLGFSESGTSAAAPSGPWESLLGFASMSVRSSGWADCSWLKLVSLVSKWTRVPGSVSWVSGWASICDVRVGLGPVEWRMWVRASAGWQGVVWGWALWLDGCCCCSQRFFKTLRFPLRSVEARGSATWREKQTHLHKRSYSAWNPTCILNLDKIRLAFCIYFQISSNLMKRPKTVCKFISQNFLTSLVCDTLYYWRLKSFKMTMSKYIDFIQRGGNSLSINSDSL